jgi:hypothetical protein
LSAERVARPPTAAPSVVAVSQVSRPDFSRSPSPLREGYR